MKRPTGLASLLLLSFAVMVGCTDKSTSTTTIKKEGPGGTTEIKETVKQTGKNPPAP